MPFMSIAAVALAVFLIGYVPGSSPVGFASGIPVHAPSELVGRWALIASIVDGEDVSKSAVTQARVVVHYTFKEDGTFVIAAGDSVRETGIWSADAGASPKIFDHTWNTTTGPGPMIHGIYETADGILEVSMVGPTATLRPTKFESKAGNGSRIYIFRRVRE